MGGMDIKGHVLEGSGLDDTPDVTPDASAFRVYYDTRKGALQLSLGDIPAYQPLYGPSPGPLSQASWYIDAAAGDDDNDGATALTPLATFAEYQRRLGGGEALASQTVYFLTDVTEDLIITASYPAGLTLQGTRTVLRAGTVTAAQDWDTSVDPVVDGQITDATLPASWAAYVGKMVQFTSGAANGQWTFVLADLGANVGRINKPINSSYASSNPGVGDSYEVVELTQIVGTVQFANNMHEGWGYVLAKDIDFSDAYTPLLGQGGGVSYYGCIVRQTLSSGYDVSAMIATNIGSLFQNRIRIANSYNLFFWNCSFLDAMVEIVSGEVGFGLICPFQQPAPGSVFGTPTFVTVGQGGRCYVTAGSLGGIDIATATQSLVECQPGGQLYLGSSGIVWTLNQTNGPAIKCQPYGFSTWPVGGLAPALYVFDIGGAATEFNLGGTTTDAAALAGVGLVTANIAAAIPRV